jgi:16S rRNA (guanine527-N7)-methyltransferase
MDFIQKYFPDLTSDQYAQLARLPELYSYWNAQINVISRKDEDNFMERHVLHSLGIAKLIQFKPGTRILDIGTGGGFPGITLAILFPECNFTLVDSIGKKIKVVNEVTHELGLKNVIGIHERAEKVPGQFDFIVSRAVTAMPAFLPWTKGKILPKQNNELKNGILYLKGGDLTTEMAEVKLNHTIHSISDYFKEEFFETKKIVHIPLR